MAAERRPGLLAWRIMGRSFAFPSRLLESHLRKVKRNSSKTHQKTVSFVWADGGPGAGESGHSRAASGGWGDRID